MCSSKVDLICSDEKTLVKSEMISVSPVVKCCLASQFSM